MPNLTPTHDTQHGVAYVMQHSTQLVWTHMICEKYDTQDKNGHVKHTDT